jgi:peptide/nickel transport system permease protein
VIGFTIRRTLQALLVALGVATLIFTLIHLLPGNQAAAILGQQRDPQLYLIYDQQNGINDPLPVQYWDFLVNLLHGQVAFVPPQLVNQPNPIESGLYPNNASIGLLVTGPLVNTLLLLGLSYVLVLVVSIPLGMYLGQRRRSGGSLTILGVAYTVYATPAFVLAFGLVDVLGVVLNILPVSPPSWGTGHVLSDPAGLVLPVLALALGEAALFTRYLRSAMIGVLVEDYVQVARAKGVSNRRLLRVHVLRNSLIPLISLLGLRFSSFLAVDAVVEVVFQYPGIGLWFLNAALGREFYTLLGIVLIAGTMSVLGSLFADLAYAWADPRIRYRR